MLMVLINTARQWKFRIAVCLGSLLVVTLLLFAVYCRGALENQYYYSDPFTTIDLTKWSKNGTVSAASGRLYSVVDPDGGSVISTIAVPDSTSEYEVKATLRIADSDFGTYITYLRATLDAMSGPSPQGTYYSVELQKTEGSSQGTLSAYRRQGGVITLLAATTIATHDYMTVRAIMRSSQIDVYVDDLYLV